MGERFIDPLADVHWDVPPTGSAAQFLANHQDMIADIIAATKIKHCDFHVDLVHGFDVPVSHLGHMRDMARMLQNDANRVMSSPNGPHAAAERLVALIRLGRHSGHDPMLIDKLVCMSILGLASESIAAWKDKIALEDRRAILAEVQAVKSERLFEIKPVVRQELAASRVAIESGKDINLPGRGDVAISSSERPGIMRAVEHVHHYVEEVWDQTDAQKKIAVAITAMQDPKARFFVLNWDTYRKQCSDIDAKLDKALAAVK